MALFNRNESTTRNGSAAARPAAASRTATSETPEDARVINGEASQRRNVPAVAMGSQRRPTSISMPMQEQRRPDLTSSERRLIVGRDIALAGEIDECDQLVVEGTMEATLRAGKRLDVYQTGLYRGSATVQEADIAGRFEGELNVAGRLRLRGTSQVSGNIRYSEIEVEAGAQISGQFQFVPPQVPANDIVDVPYSFRSSGANTDTTAA